MIAPRLEIRLDRIHHNARTLVRRLGERGVSVTGVTKATLGSPDIARALLRAGVTSIGESRIENIEALRSRRGGGADDADPLADAQPGRSSRRARRRQPEHRARRARSAVDLRSSAGSSPRGRPHGRARGPSRGHPAAGPRVRRAPDAAASRTSTFGASVPTSRARAASRPTTATWPSSPGWPQQLEAKLGMTFDIVSGGNSANLDWALGCRRARTDQRPPPGRVDPARLRAAPAPARSTVSTPTRSPWSPR